MAGSGSIHDGGRALEAAVRPYPCRVAGEPLSLAFDLKSKTFEFTFRHAGEVEAPTELFVPELQYPRGYTVEVSDGTFEAGRAPQTLLYRHTREREVHSLRLRPKGQLARSKK
jgi:hypothetical protein